MKREKITITEDCVITLPSNPPKTIWMRDFEMAELFGVMLPTVKSNIRAILKSNVVTEDTTNGATLVGRNILPDYFGLDMLITLAFRINSYKAEILRRWIIEKVSMKRSSTNYQILIPIGGKYDNKILN